MNGYIKLFRQFNKWGWYDDTNTKIVFLDILLNVNWKPSEYHGYKLDAGQGVFGRKKMAKRLKISEQSVRTALDHLQLTNEITIKSTNRFSIITVENWGKYQGYENETNQQTNQQLTNKQPTTNQQLTTEEEYKNIKNKEIKNSCSSIKDLLTSDELNDLYEIYDNQYNSVSNLFAIIDKDFKLKKKSFNEIEQPFRYVIGVAKKLNYITNEEKEKHLQELMEVLEV